MSESDIDNALPAHVILGYLLDVDRLANMMSLYVLFVSCISGTVFNPIQSLATANKQLRLFNFIFQPDMDYASGVRTHL